ncbi:MAG: serine--tRNA ligase [Candidatus Komeilibacteria bacterium]
MLDIKFIQANKEQVLLAIKNKNIKVDLDRLLTLHEQRSDVLKQIENLNQEKKANAFTISGQKGKPDQELIELGKKIKSKLDVLQQRFDQIDQEYNQLMLQVPNVYSEDTPIGPDEAANKEIQKNGEVKNFDFPIKDHIELGLAHDLLDFDRGVKVAGFRGYYLKNELALMHWGIVTLALQKMAHAGFTVMIPPSIVKEMPLVGAGYFPFGKEEIYSTQETNSNDIRYLTGTSEPSLLAYRADEIIAKKDLPLKYVGVSQCFRREAGSYGKDTKGLYRVHEFLKVEQVVICEADFHEAEKYWAEMLSYSVELLQELGLPHRLLHICTGDMGAGKYKMYDIETWMPSRNAYGETHSLSLFTDWQSRRLNLRYKDGKGNNIHPFALNNTVIASPRILIAILENYQQADGSIAVPEVLQPFVGKKVIK